VEEKYNLQRFVEAQDAGYSSSVLEQAKRELRNGSKKSHWMWFIFPQIRGLGSSSMAQMYAISSLDEAKAYLQHPILGERLRECVRLVNSVEGRTRHEIFGSPDDMKFHSSMTLFALADPKEQLFASALQKYCGGASDGMTVERLKR
jgi:uncharacterized protein (DUF1810 family)